MPRLILAWCASLYLLAGTALGAGGAIEGQWLTDDHKAIVEIARCGSSLCGRIAKVLDADPTVPRTDVHNPDSRARIRPITGLPILYGFVFRNGRWSGGTAYDPKSGRTYRASLDLAGAGSPRVTGCVLFICQTKIWARQS